MELGRAIILKFVVFGAKIGMIGYFVSWD